ncbi:MAG: MerR family DNA-binding protein [Desulfarculales bacterium]|jgi:DNA-binding transcriptional MerR regulator|nr:MerR family DNA-binding protein [Desulfarculales bacterium]
MRLLETILCLKSTGMKLKEIKQYIAWVMDGPDTVAFRRELMTEHREAVKRQIRELKENLALIDAKLKIYQSPDAAEIVIKQLRSAAKERQGQGLCAMHENALAQ